MDNLLEQITNISKAHAYDILVDQVKELKEEKTILVDALRRIKATYDNEEDLAGVISKEALSKIKY